MSKRLLNRGVKKDKAQKYITSLFVAIGFSAYVSTEIFETSYTPNATIIASGLITGFVLILLTGMFVVYRALSVPAVKTLRS